MGVGVAVAVGGTRVSVGGAEVAVGGPGVTVGAGRVAVAAARAGVDVARAAGAASLTAVTGRAVAVGRAGVPVGGAVGRGRGVTVAVGAAADFSSYRTPGVRSEREAEGAVTTGIEVRVGAGGAPAGLAGMGVGVGVASLATVTRVVRQLETARRTIMAASALFMMPSRSIYRSARSSLGRGTGGLGDWETWGTGRLGDSR